MKKLIIVMAVATGFVGCQNDVGRYQFRDRFDSIMLDTKTGISYKSMQYWENQETGAVYKNHCSKCEHKYYWVEMVNWEKPNLKK